MKSTYIKLEINISALEGKFLPEEDDILHKLIERLYEFSIEDSAIVDQVHITEVNGKSTNED